MRAPLLPLLILAVTGFLLLLSVPVTASAPTTNTVHGFIVAHSHCDAGWRLTLEQYYEQQVREDHIPG